MAGMAASAGAVAVRYLVVVVVVLYLLLRRRLSASLVSFNSSNRSAQNMHKSMISLASRSLRTRSAIARTSLPSCYASSPIHANQTYLNPSRTAGVRCSAPAFRAYSTEGSAPPAISSNNVHSSCLSLINAILQFPAEPLFSLARLRKK